MAGRDRDHGASGDGFCPKHGSVVSIRLRRNVLMAHWAAGRLAMAGEHWPDYALDLTRADCEVPGDEDLIARIIGDLGQKGMTVCPNELAERLQSFHRQALRETAETD